VFSKINKVGDGRIDFGEVSNSCWMISPQTVGFYEDEFLLDPCKQLVFRAVELDTAEAVVAEHVAADANMCLILFVIASGQHIEEFLKFIFACQKQGGCKDDLFVVAWGVKD